MTVMEAPSLSLADIDAASVISFSDGLVGCGDWKHFVLLTSDEEELPVGVLQCIDEPSVRFMVTDPRLIDSSYDPSISLEDKLALGLAPDSRPVIYCTLTVANNGTITANLLGPLAINVNTRQAKQLVLSEGDYSARHPVGQVG